jgi:hypothetical protein
MILGFIMLMQSRGSPCEQEAARVLLSNVFRDCSRELPNVLFVSRELVCVCFGGGGGEL